VSEPEPLRAPRVFSRDYVPPEPPRRRRWGRWLLLVLLLLFLTPPGVVLALRWVAPPTTAFMLQSPTQPVDYVWVPAAQQPQVLRDAVIAAEDQKFYTHHGFDYEAIAKALEHNQKSRRKRGASTITQQVAKNLFMWPSRSYLRKGLEASFTVLIELAWPKERILEVYLNVAEFGPGTYGVEAAARKFFDKSAQELSPGECARLAAVLPNPRKWSAKRPGPYVQTRVDWILAYLGYGPKPATLEQQLDEPLEEPLEPPPDAAVPDESVPAEGAPAEAQPAPAPAEGEPVEGAAPAAEPAPAQPSEVPPPDQAPVEPADTEAPGATEPPAPTEPPPPT
jgi:monofunctional biosynthetic peptidoglycan transglycosylase